MTSSVSPKFVVGSQVSFTYNDKAREGVVKVVGEKDFADSRSSAYIVLDEVGRTRNYNIAKMSDVAFPALELSELSPELTKIVNTPVKELVAASPL